MLLPVVLLLSLLLHRPISVVLTAGSGRIGGFVHAVLDVACVWRACVLSGMNKMVENFKKI